MKPVLALYSALVLVCHLSEVYSVHDSVFVLVGHVPIVDVVGVSLRLLTSWTLSKTTGSSTLSLPPWSWHSYG